MSTRPRRLREGDTVAVVTSSWGGPSVFPDVFEAGLDTLRGLGLVVVEMPSTRWSPTQLAADPRQRAEDLNSAFADRDVAAIVSSIGGEDSARILPFLDTEVIRSNPKVFLGYSDTVAPLLFVHRLGLVTFHGPAVMAGLAQARHFPGLLDHLRGMLFEPSPTSQLRAFPSWVDGYGEWRDAEDPTGVGPMQPHDGWHWLNGSQPARGRLVGGCIEVLELLKGSHHWPEQEWWRDRVLFLETSEDVPTIGQVRNWLFDYGVQGTFDRVSALLIGRARGYTAAQKGDLDETVRSVVVDAFGATDLVIVSNLDFGHTDPQWILPLGVLTEVDPVERRLTLLEPAVV